MVLHGASGQSDMIRASAHTGHLVEQEGRVDLSAILHHRYQRCQQLFARWYPNFRNAGEQYHDLIAAVVSQDTTLIDIGCGRMSLAETAIRIARRSVGVDLSLSDLQQNMTVSQRVLADAGHLPFATASFDVLVSQWTIEHLPDPQPVFDEMSRVVRPGSPLILFTTNAHHYIPLVSRLIPDSIQRFLIQGLLQRPDHESHPTFYRANTRRTITTLAHRAGLQLHTCVYVGNPFYLAFSPLLFRLALIYEKITDIPALCRFKLYMLVVLVKEGTAE